MTICTIACGGTIFFKNIKHSLSHRYHRYATRSIVVFAITARYCVCASGVRHGCALGDIATCDGRRTLAPGFESTLSNTIKNHAHTGVIIYCGGDEGIRTLDTLAGILHFQCSALDQLCDVSSLAGILHFQCSALDQLCDVSCNRKWHYSSDSAAVSSDSDSGSVTPVNSSAGSSSKAFSNSASISRNCGSSPLAISNDSSSSAIAGVSL